MNMELIKVDISVDVCFNFAGSIIPELQNRVTHYDVTNRVTNAKFELVTPCEKSFHIILELATRDY